MAADYDKLFRPHEGMEAPDDMAAQPFFDPSASFPPAPASANLPKPNGQTPPPTSDDLSERFVSAPPPPPHPHLRLRQLRCRSPQESRPRRNRPHLNHPHPHAHRRTRTGPTQTTHTSDAHRRTCTHPNRIPVGAPRPPTPQTPTGAPQQPESPAPHVPSHGPHQPRRTAPAPPWAKMPIGEPRPLRPDRLRPRPNHRPGLPPNTPDVRRGHRYRTDTERNVGKVATGPSIQARLRAEEASGAQLAPERSPRQRRWANRDRIWLRPPAPRRQNLPQPLAAAQLRSACRATRPPRFSRPTCRGAT